MPDVDVAILGGGCAGLSLAARLARTGLSFRVVEPREIYHDDRAWSFWRTAPDPFADCVRASWSRWTVAGPSGLTVRSSQRYPYQSLTAAAFYARALSLIDDAPRGSLACGVSAGAVTVRSAGAHIDTSDGGFTAAHVIDARPPRRQPEFGQFFLGREIVTDGAVFDPETVTLMHFRGEDASGIRFLYLLPYARDRALVEVTVFAQDAPDAGEMASWLAAEIAGCGGGHHTVLREEKGALPMEAGYREPAAEGVIRIGLAGGAARPSTGYAFQRIQLQTQALTTCLLRGVVPQVPQDGAISRFMDRVFLQVLRAAPERGPALFERLFRNTPPDRLERFLSGSLRAADRLSVIASLPPLPFLRAAVPLRASPFLLSRP